MGDGQHNNHTDGTDDSHALVLTVAEVAQVLRVSRWTVYEAIRRGEIRALQVGRALRIARLELDQLLAGTAASNTSTATPPRGGVFDGEVPATALAADPTRDRGQPAAASPSAGGTSPH